MRTVEILFYLSLEKAAAAGTLEYGYSKHSPPVGHLTPSERGLLLESLQSGYWKEADVIASKLRFDRGKPVAVEFVRAGEEPAEALARVLREELARRDGSPPEAACVRAPVDPLDDGAAWQVGLLAVVSAAMLDCAAKLAERDDLADLDGNLLSGIGKLARDAVQRAALLWVLDENHWNMTATSALLRLGSASNVLRAIKELGLEKELGTARRTGLVVRGSHGKRRVP